MKSLGGTELLLPVATASVIVALVAIGNHFDRLPDPDPDLQFVEEALIADHDSALGVRRWIDPVVIAVYSDENSDMRLGRDAVTQFNDALGGTGLVLRIESERTPPANVDIVFLPREHWNELWDDLDQDPFIRGWAEIWSMNEDHPEILTRGRIVVDPRQPREDRLATVLHELFHVVADAGHSQRNESVLNQSDFAGVVRLTALAEVDRALLRFLYGAVAPGDSADDVRWKFTYAWPLRTAAQ